MPATEIQNPAEKYVRPAPPVKGLSGVVRRFAGHNAEGKSVNNEVDIKYAPENEPGITVHIGSVCHMIDFAPGSVSPMHRINSLDYVVVIEGVFRMILSSGEERLMQRGDIAAQRSKSYRWVNVTGNGLLPGRILFVLLDINDLHIGGEKVQRELGLLGNDYVRLPSHEAKDKAVCGRGPESYGSEFFDSEF